MRWAGLYIPLRTAAPCFTRRRTLACLALPLLVSAATLAAQASPASADACSSQSQQRCYNIALWAPADQNAQIDANMDVECLYESSPSSNFVDEQIWEGTDNNSSGTYWVETGMTEGVPWGSGRVFFWADNRPTYGYAQHEVTGITANINTNYALELNWQPAANEWAVWIAGTNVGNSTSNPAYSKYVAGGSEFTNVGVRAAAQFSFLDWYAPGGTRYQSWGGSGEVIGTGSVSVPAAPYTNFSNYYDGTGTCTTGAAAQSSGSTVSAVDVVNPVPSSSLSSTTQSELLQLTESTAASLGEPTPGNITVVPTTRYAANQILGSTINNASGHPDMTGVYLVQATGSFTSLRGSPGGGSATRPTGSALTLVVDPATNSILDLGISPNPILETSLSALGTVTSLSGQGAS